MSQTTPPKKYEYVPFTVMEQQQQSPTLDPASSTSTPPPPPSPLAPTHSTPPPSSHPSTAAAEMVTNGTLTCSPDSGVASPSTPLAPESTDRPKPVPKPRANYQTVQLTGVTGDTSSSDAPAVPQSPQISQKPQDYLLPFPKGVPQSSPHSETLGKRKTSEGTSGQPEREGAEVSALPSVVSAKGKEPVTSKDKSPAPSPSLKQGVNSEDGTESNGTATAAPPPVPSRITECFKKQASFPAVPVKPLPPKPRPRSKTVPKMSTMPSPAELNWRPTGETMTLAQLAETQSDKFPIKIHLLDGYYGQTSRFTLSASDVFNVHFTKHVKVMTTRDSMSTTYTVPLNSAIKFGIIYDIVEEETPGAVKSPGLKKKGSGGSKSPEHETEKVFATVADLMALKTLPKVVCALCTSDGKLSNKLSVKRNEILIIKGIYKPALKHRKALKCYSIQEECKKLLPANCLGNFSVAPQHTQIHVLEFANKLKNVFPCQAMMFLGSEGDYESSVYRSIPKALFKKPITLVNVTMEVSLVATSPTVVASTPTPSDERYQTGPQAKADRGSQLLEIPLDSHLGDLEVEILEAPNETETEKLYMNTQAIMAQYNPRHYMVLLDKGSDRANDAQSGFYMTVRSDLEKVGVELHTSQAVYDRIESKKKKSETEADGYERMDCGDTGQKKVTESAVSQEAKGKKRASYEKAAPKEKKGATTKGPAGKGFTSKKKPSVQIPPPKEEDSDSGDDHIYEMIDDEARASFQASSHVVSPPLPRYPGSPPFSPMHLHNPPPQPQHWLHEQYQPPMTTTQPPLPVYPGVSAQPPPSSYVHMFPGGPPQPRAMSPPLGADTAAADHTQVPIEVIAANKLFVRNMTLINVLDLLSAMNLNQYKAAFSKEMVSGEILLECNEADLEKELGVTSKIHRIRLMKVVSGHHSARSILEGQSPYEL